MAANTLLYVFDPVSDRLRAVDTGVSRPLRWATWHPREAWCLLAGNGGTALRYDGLSSRFEPVDTGTKQNLRGVAFAPDGGTALIVGNRGLVLLYDRSTDAIRGLASPTKENLRRAAFAPDGSVALVVGNTGTVLRYQDGVLTPVPGDRAHTLRALAFRPDGAYALVGAYASAYAGYPRPHALYRCDGRYLQAMLATDEEDDFVAVDWHPDGTHALIAGYAYDGSADRFANKLLVYDGRGFTSRAVEASGALLGASWHPGGEYALLCGEDGALLRYRDARIEQIDSGTRDNLVGPFWARDGAWALLLRGPSERVYTV